LLYDLQYLLETRLPRLDRCHDLLNQRGLLGDFGKFVFNILQYLHGVVLSVEYLGHDLHMAFGNGLLVPQFLEISEGLVYGFFLPFLIPAQIGFISDFVLLIDHLLFSSEG
jgi:hypothetical protein